MTLHTPIKALTLLLLALAMLPMARPATVAAGDERCFPQTGQCISGRFREYWEQNGGLSIFGYPITPARNEVNADTGQTYLTQWFERNRFELHPENAAPYDVLLGRLGADRLARIGRNWQAEGREAGPREGCLWFAQTGHNVCDQAPQGGQAADRGFMSYWRTAGLSDPRLDAYGRSLALHGLPLTEARMETNSSGDRVLTQWFERGRMEWHPNNPSGFRVLLGLLGNELRSTPAAARPPIFYISQRVLYRVDANGRAERVTDITTTLGGVLHAVTQGDEVVLLREGGLQRVSQAGTRTIAEFTRGAARFGELVTTANSNQIIYTYSRDASTPMGFEGVAGVIDGMSATKVLDAPNNLKALGLTTDAKAMYVIYQGQDPSFVQVRVVQIPNGQVLANLPISGENAARLSADRLRIATVSRGPDINLPDTVTFYDLLNQTGAPRPVRLASAGRAIWQLVWAPDGSAVYAWVTAANDPSKGELWRVERESRQSRLVASNLPEETRLSAVSADGRTLLAQVRQGALLIDLTNGTTRVQSITPEGSILVDWP
jgi:hypothetical protein